jgi:uncharacterized protein (UPF0332 family)
MTWDEMAIDLLQAAKAMHATHPRSAASRAYYAAHIALAKVLQASGFVPAARRSTQSHDAQRRLIGLHLVHLGDRRVRDLRALFVRLYARRIDSDYIRTAQVDRSAALDAIRDASSVFVMLGIQEAA